MKELLEFILKNILGDKSKFKVTEVVNDSVVTLTIVTEDKDGGLVIGKMGKTIKAIRNILRIRATIDKKKIILKSPAIIINGRLYVPQEGVNNGYDIRSHWDDKEDILYLTSVNILFTGDRNTIAIGEGNIVSISERYGIDKISDKITYEVAKIICEPPPDVKEVYKDGLSLTLNLPKMWFPINKDLPIHPGALKYFKEKGLL